ncbi:MAG: hypothetical protein H7Y10_08520 [Flavobacterium sp.]|nr:hypothetical protein [Flavobacterium sp.]
MFDFLKPNTEPNVFQRLANETNGEYIPPKYDESAKTEVMYGEWKITCDYFIHYATVGGNNQKTYSRVIFAYNATDDFRFEIYNNGFIRLIEKIFGAQDIEIGRSNFDKKYIIKSNNQFKIKSFLQNEMIRKGIESLEEVNILISDQKGIWEEKLPGKEFELSYFSSSTIKNTDEFKTLLTLFKQMIDELNSLKLIRARN